MTRKQAGNYTCHASNVEGDAESKPVTLTIMCKYLVVMFLVIYTNKCKSKILAVK